MFREIIVKWFGKIIMQVTMHKYTRLDFVYVKNGECV